MRRQKTILSFFQKPSPGNQNPTSADNRPLSKHPDKPDEMNSFISADKLPAAVTSSDSCLEIETPPEKLPRRVLNVPEAGSGGGRGDGEKPSLFSSIMHKFARESGSEKAALQQR